MLLSRTHRVAVGVAAAAIALAGCGSSASASGPAGGGNSSGNGTWAQSEGTIFFGVVPDQAGSDAASRPLLDYIEKETGYKVSYYPTADYTALIAAAAAGKLDVMESGGLEYVTAVNKGAHLEAVAATLTSPDVTDPGYYSEAIVPKGSSITSLADAAGKKVCFVDPNSTSGFLYGLYQLSNAGVKVDTSGTDANGNPNFSAFTAFFAGAHDKSAQAVASGQCDVGFAEDSVAEAAAAAGKVTVIGKEYVPGGPLAVSTTLPDDARNKITQALQGATVEAIKASGVSVTDGFTSSYFGVQPEKADYYDAIQKLCSSIPSAKCAK